MDIKKKEPTPSGSGTGPVKVSRIGDGEKRKADEGNGEREGKRKAMEKEPNSLEYSGKDKLVNEVASLREENRKLKKGQEPEVDTINKVSTDTAHTGEVETAMTSGSEQPAVKVVKRAPDTLEDFLPPFNKGFTRDLFPENYDAVVKGNRVLWLYGGTGYGKTAWKGLAFPQEKGYLFVRSSWELKKCFDPSKHIGIVLDAISIGIGSWPAKDLYNFICTGSNGTFQIGNKEVKVPMPLQRIVVDLSSPSDVLKMYKKTKGWQVEVLERIIPLEVTNYMFPVTPENDPRRITSTRLSKYGNRLYTRSFSVEEHLKILKLKWENGIEDAEDKVIEMMEDEEEQIKVAIRDGLVKPGDEPQPHSASYFCDLLLSRSENPGFQVPGSASSSSVAGNRSGMGEGNLKEN